MPKFCSHGGAWRVKMHICTCFDTTASPNPCIILWDQLQKKDTIITISCGSFLSNTKKRKKSHLTSRLNQGLEESTTHNYQIQTVPCPSFALEEEEQSFASILWEWWNLVMTFVFSLKQLCIEWNFYSIFNPGWSGMSLLSPSFPIVFSFSSVTKTRESQNELNGEEEVKDLPNHLSQEKHLDFPCLSLFQKSSSF